MRTASNICVVLVENKVEWALDVEMDCHSHQTLGASCTQRPRRAMPAIQQTAKVSKLLMILTRGMVRDGAGWCGMVRDARSRIDPGGQLVVHRCVVP